MPKNPGLTHLTPNDALAHADGRLTSLISRVGLVTYTPDELRDELQQVLRLLRAAKTS